MSLSVHPPGISEFSLHSFMFSLIILSSLYVFTKWLLKPSGNKKQPPSPPKLPILGNLHQLGRLTHRSLQSLGRKYGPFMLLHFGSLPVIIVQSADAAIEILKKHDLAFADKPNSSTTRRLLYDSKDILTASYSEYWRRLKSLCVLQLLSNKRVNSFRFIRETETALLIEKIKACASSPMNLSEMFVSLSNDIICRSVFGKKYNEGEKGKEFLQLLDEVMRLMGSINIGEFIPSLSWINYVTGFDGRVDKCAKVVDAFLDVIIQEHLNGEYKDGEGRENFLAILLQIYKESKSCNADGASIDIDNVKAIILDLIIAGTDTTSATLEWAMTELLCHPTVMNKLQKEVIDTIGDKQSITDPDLEKMHYLKAVVKETLRYHPPTALLARVAREDVTVMGYEIAAGTMTIINAWAISRDPLSWEEPEKFWPERFLNSSIDYKGQDFKFIPFGAGRRGCPGITFGTASVELVLANLMHKFTWNLPDGKTTKDLETIECPGITLHRQNPLFAVATTQRRFYH